MTGEGGQVVQHPAAVLRRRARSQVDDVLLHYQPVLDLVTGEVLAFEALARWEHPTQGLLPAGDFIPFAERSGSIARLGAALLERACHEALPWTSAAGRRIGVSVNVSARQLATSHLVVGLTRALGRSGLDPSLLTIEITETSAVGDDAEWMDSITAIRRWGVQVMIDDFGSGYSLDSLRRLPVDGFKIDRDFVAGLDDAAGDPTNTAIVSAMVTLGRALSLTVVAEGIETATQRDRLVTMGCRHGQGFLFAQPMPAGAALSYLDASLRLPAVSPRRLGARPRSLARPSGSGRDHGAACNAAPRNCK